jgi:hypothetical protein
MLNLLRNSVLFPPILLSRLCNACCTTHSSITLRTFHSYSTRLPNRPLVLQTTLNSRSETVNDVQYHLQPFHRVHPQWPSSASDLPTFPLPPLTLDIIYVSPVYLLQSLPKSKALSTPSTDSCKVIRKLWMQVPIQNRAIYCILWILKICTALARSDKI